MEYVLKYDGAWGDVDNLLSLSTGEWRTHRPVVDHEKCVNCGWCYLYCPPGCIREEGDQFVIDLNFCKGCGICSSVCPVNAITMTSEG
ncbi:MAG TPA: 4Fe-4S binding protein [Desulfohalobiaceae bacterium]|nr:4Fe-4S binding protein [Desulfohalobiaceae bacterium]